MDLPDNVWRGTTPGRGSLLVVQLALAQCFCIVGDSQVSHADNLVCASEIVVRFFALLEDVRQATALVVLVDKGEALHDEILAIGCLAFQRVVQIGEADVEIDGGISRVQGVGSEIVVWMDCEQMGQSNGEEEED